MNLEFIRWTFFLGVSAILEPISKVVNFYLDTGFELQRIFELIKANHSLSHLYGFWIEFPLLGLLMLGAFYTKEKSFKVLAFLMAGIINIRLFAYSPFEWPYLTDFPHLYSFFLGVASFLLMVLIISDEDILSAPASDFSSLKETPPKSLKRTILVIDDDVRFLALAQRKLKAKGYQVITCQRGRMGVHHANSLHPDLILIDKNMPFLDGLETSRAIQKNPMNRNIPLIGVSADQLSQKEKSHFTNVHCKSEGIESLVASIQRTIKPSDMAL